MKSFLIFLALFISLNATTLHPTEHELKQKIGRMLMVGFDDEKLYRDSKIVKDINRYAIGGVILFDRFYDDRAKVKNISSPKQLKELTKKLKHYSTKALFIAVDQEGGKVARLKAKYGFDEFPSAKEVSALGYEKAKEIYKKQAIMLSEMRIDCDFAPVVDLAVNPKNKVIYGLERSYGSDAKEVAKYAEIFMDELEVEDIVSVVKHFPGHGSSLADSHKGFVDVSKTWSKKELEPYQILIDKQKLRMVMTAHVFNSQLDEKYPATLSYKVNTKLLRNKMGFNGVIISDDLQMKAISSHYSLKETVTLAINAGVDMLLFGNQLADQDIDELIETIYKQVKSGAIPYERILESNKRIKYVLKY